MITDGVQIVGFRKDRLGARIVALGNLLFLEDKFGVSVRFLWTSQSEDHNMDINDEQFPIFDPKFKNQYLTQVSGGDREAIVGLTDLEEVRGKISAQLFVERLDAGERFVCTNGFEPALFANELGPHQITEFRASISRITWAPPIYEALDFALGKLAELNAEPVALHVRRGDVLDKAPWCHRSWTAKFAPDEFYTAVMDQPDTATILFSDTPEVVRRLTAGREKSTTLDDLIDAPNLSLMQRDIVELLLMAHCGIVVAPTLSAFSSSALVIGGTRSIKLPSDLPEPQKTTAYDAVLARVLSGPSSYYNDGDFAQSLSYAFRHALNVGQYRALYGRLKSVMESGQDFAFYLPIAMALGIACDDAASALKLDEVAKRDPNLWASDRMVCATLGRLADHIAGNKTRATTDFLKLYFARNKADASQDSLAHYFYEEEPTFQSLFQLDAVVVKTVCHNVQSKTFLFPKGDEFLGGVLNTALPLWITGADWTEMFDKKMLQKNLTNSPSFEAKRALFPKEIILAERNAFRDNTPLPTDFESLSLLSAYAVALRLSGRYRRASHIMYHCRNTEPKHPIFLKRLGDLLLTIGKIDGARNNFEKALQILPSHPGLTIAYAGMAQNDGDHSTAAKLFANNAAQDVLPFNYFKSWELSMRKISAVNGARDVILEAYRRFPEQDIFEKRWADRL